MSTYPAVADLVPHEPPMLALEEVVFAESGRATSRVVLREGMQFVVDGHLETVVTLEYMAQTVAACLRLEALRLRDESPVRVGMIVACRSMAIHRPRLQVGEVLSCEVNRVSGTGEASFFEGRTRDASNAVVSEVSMTLVHAAISRD